MLALVKNPFKRGGDSKIPVLFTLPSGILPETDPDTVDLVNRVMVDWSRVYRKIRPTKGMSNPFYSPSSQMTALRQLFAFLSTTCGWVIGLDDLKGFDGCLHSVLTKLFDERQKAYVSFFCAGFNWSKMRI